MLAPRRNHSGSLPEVNRSKQLPRLPLADEDSDIEEVINYRRTVNSNTQSYAMEHQYTAKPRLNSGVEWWDGNTTTNKWEGRAPFIPCSHEGSCEKAKCRCYSHGIHCEKTCKCSASCIRRFPGCSCKHVPGEASRCVYTFEGTYNTSKCLCQRLNRECDADICDECGATDTLDPVNRYNDKVKHGKCCNVGIQRGVPKKTLLGHSEVHGFGLYLGEDVRKGDLIGEYKGEVVTQSEAERREVIYKRERTQYVFNLNTGKWSRYTSDETLTTCRAIN
jgi:hypothetical protein